MDVHCSSCNHPWDAYHLRHDVISETDLDSAEAYALRNLPSSQQLSRQYRDKLKAVGYEFGGSILNMQRCPCCPRGAKPDADRAAMRTRFVEILGDDDDAIAATMEDFGL